MEHALHSIATNPPTTMSDSAALPSGLLSLPTVYINPNGPFVTRTVGSDSTGGEEEIEDGYAPSPGPTGPVQKR